MELQEYDNRRPCAVCGYANLTWVAIDKVTTVKLTGMDEQGMFLRGLYFVANDWPTVLLGRRCLRCGHTWVELPLNHGEAD